MKSLMVLTLIFSLSSWAHSEVEEKPSSNLQDRINSEFGIFPAVGRCHFELTGSNIPSKKFTEKKDMDLAECNKKAKQVFKQSDAGYSKLLIKHSSQEKWIVVERTK